MAKFSDVFVPDSIVIKSDVSPDQQVVTSLLQNMLIALEPAKLTTVPGKSLSEPLLSAIRSVTMFAPMKFDQAQPDVRVVIRGNVDIKPNARAVLVSRLAGNTFADDVVTSADGTYQFVHCVKLTSTIGFLTTLVLLVDRDFVDNSVPFVSVSVENIELSIVPPTPTPS